MHLTTVDLKDHHKKGRNHPVTIHVHGNANAPTSHKFEDVCAAVSALEVRLTGEKEAERLKAVKKYLDEACLELQGARDSFVHSQDGSIGFESSAKDVAVAFLDGEKAFAQATQLASDSQQIVTEMQNILNGVPVWTIQQDIWFLEKTRDDAQRVFRDCQEVANDAQAFLSDMKKVEKNLVCVLKNLASGPPA